MTEIPNQSFRMPASDAKHYLEQASVLMNLGRFQEAIPLYESALATLERVYGVDQPEIAECLQDLGEAYEAGYRLGDALAIHTRLLHMGEKILGKANPNVVAMLFKLTQLNELLGRPADALVFCEQALESAKQCLAQDDPLSQHIIDRYRYLTNLAQTEAQYQTQPQTQQDMQQELQTQPPQSNRQTERPQPQIDGGYPQPTNMQDFAREMLQDMPGSQMPFGQAINAGNLSSANNPIQQVQQDQPAPYNQALNAVAPPQFSQQNNNYKAVLEAGFSAAQNHGFQATQPHDPYAGVSGSTPPAPPAYEPGGEGYSLSDLDDIRSGRREKAEMSSQVKGVKTRRISAEDNKRILLGRLAKDFALPALVLVVVLGLLIFVIISTRGSGQKTASSGQEVAKTAVYGFYRTCDGDKEVRLVSGNTALLVTAGSAIEIPYILITSNWGDLFSAMTSSVFEKQIWAEKKNYGLKTQEEIVYYANDGPEAKVIAKMRHLAGYAQAYFVKKNEYPKYVAANMVNEFAFVNPVDGRGLPVQIKTLISQTSDGADAEGGLEAGLEPGLAPNSNTEASLLSNAPCSITCYALVVGKPEDNLEGLRAVKFFIRGCDRNGALLSSGHAGRTYVVTADNTYLAALPAVAISDATPRAPASSRSKVAAKARIKGKVKAQPKAPVQSSASDTADIEQDKNKTDQAALPAVRSEKPDKSTRLWLIENPAYPMVLMHHSLALIFIGMAVLAYLQSKVVHVEAAGTSIAETSNAPSHYAKIAAAIFLALAVIVLLIQFLIFA